MVAGLAICVTREMLSLLSDGVTSVEGSTGVTRFSSQGLWGPGPPSRDVEVLATGSFASFGEMGEMLTSSSVKREVEKEVRCPGQPQHNLKLSEDRPQVPAKAYSDQD